MKGKLVPIPSENIGAVRVALQVRITALRGYFSRNKNYPNVMRATLADMAALTWAIDNLEERPEVEIGGGH